MLRMYAAWPSPSDGGGPLPMLVAVCSPCGDELTISPPASTAAALLPSPAGSKSAAGEEPAHSPATRSHPSPASERAYSIVSSHCAPPSTLVQSIGAPRITFELVCTKRPQSRL